MRRGAAVITVLLAFIWLGMPVHCQLEPFSWAGLFACVDDQDCNSPEDEGCADDFCDSLESGKYFSKKQDVQAAVPIFHLLRLLAERPERDDRLDFSVDTSLAILNSSWQFHYRTAAPPRAPSLIS